MKKVSLIVPIYNTAKYLDKCILSLVNQSLKDIEIILINDGSTDNSEEVIKKYDDERIVYINKENEGIGKTRNLGIEVSTGEYIAFVDSDDYLHLDFCKKMYEKSVKDKCDIVICDFYDDVNDKLNLRKFISFNDTSLKKNSRLINEINLGPCNKIYKRDLFKNKKNRFVENLKYEDAPLVVKLLLSAKKIGKVDEGLTYYVIHNGSETTVRDKRIFDIFKIVEMIVNDLSKAEYDKSCITNLVVMILSDYTIQQRYILNKEDRNRFIDKAFKYLDNLDKDWKKCSYLKKFSLKKRIIKTSKFLTKLYCKLYILMHSFN